MKREKFISEMNDLDLLMYIVNYSCSPVIDISNINGIKFIENDEANICLIGVEPTYPSPKFRYIIPDNNNKVL